MLKPGCLQSSLPVSLYYSVSRLGGGHIASDAVPYIDEMGLGRKTHTPPLS